ncbi:PIN domain-containing protein [Nocardioides speluncae]|uniref:PIN domain-containing protein n=1 Tax=Nocardioides speluncae TaxID=2670337 RepID=UPI000D69478E|nr:PIN domain-containing protein [Nocardioides speluncae]
MIILDTGVVTELMKAEEAAPEVASWLRNLTEPPLTTIITRAEVLAGVAALPAGRRRDRLRARAEAAFDLLGACLPLDIAATDIYGEIVATHRQTGRSFHELNGLVAAIALQAGAPLATRNIPAFEGLGIELVNPWEAAAG